LDVLVREAVLAAGGRLLEGLLDLDRGCAGPRVDCPGGHVAVFVGYRGKTIATVLGPVRVERAWYHCRACGAGVAPRDAQLGVTGGSVTAGLAEMIDTVAAVEAFAPAGRLLKTLAGVTVDAKRIERVAEADGLAAAAERSARAGGILSGKIIPLPPEGTTGGELPDMLYVAVDGTGVPTRTAETAGRAGKQPDGTARTREVKLAALFTQTRLDDHGRPARDPGSTSYLATFQPPCEFGNLVRAAAIERGLDTIRQVVVLGDGARWIWGLADTHFPAATQIVDLFQAREHLHELAKLLEFITPDPAAWLTARLTELDNGDIEAIAAAVGAYQKTGIDGPKGEQVATALAYFTANARRMRYAHYRRLGMFVGSGVVEAGCKNVIGARLKRSGTHWTIPSATAITTLRCQQATAA